MPRGSSRPSRTRSGARSASPAADPGAAPLRSVHASPIPPRERRRFPHPRQESPLEALAPLVVVVALAVGFLGVFSYNRFVAQRASIDASWAGIDVELQRRHELIPRLVETVRGYADHERGILRSVTEARARAVAATDPAVPVRDQARAEDALTEGLTGLLAITEAFPDLKADANFRDLQRQLVETEDRIAASRRLYNLEVAAYERRRQAVPSNLVASAFGFEPRASFEIQDAAARHAAQVQL